MDGWVKVKNHIRVNTKIPLFGLAKQWLADKDGNLYRRYKHILARLTQDNFLEEIGQISIEYNPMLILGNQQIRYQFNLHVNKVTNYLAPHKYAISLQRPQVIEQLTNFICEVFGCQSINYKTKDWDWEIGGILVCEIVYDLSELTKLYETENSNVVAVDISLATSIHQALIADCVVAANEDY